MKLRLSAPRCASPWQLWVKFCSAYNGSIEIFFDKFARLIARHPFKVLCVCLLVLVVLVSGFTFMKIENRAEKLYIPQQSESISDLEKARKLGFYRPYRLTELILLNNKGGNVLTKECFEDALFIHNVTTNIKGYKKLCLSKTGSNPVKSTLECVKNEPLIFFNYSRNNLDDVLEVLNKKESSDHVKLDRVFGASERDSSGKIISAEAMRLDYILKGSFVDEDVSEETLDWENEFLDQMAGISGYLKCGQLFYATGRSLDDAIIESILSDTKLISLAFGIMIIFASLMLGKFRTPPLGHGLLAIGGTFAVGMGIASAFGLAMFCGIPFVSVVGILPFVIVGVGIDDMFIIVSHLDRTNPEQDIAERTARFMSHVGPAITMTTMTDVLAFAVGISSRFPSVVYFCTYAVFAVVFAYVYLVTIFVAFTVFDCRRMNANRYDMLFCVKAQETPENPHEILPQTSSRYMRIWGQILMKPSVKSIVVLFSAVLLAAGVYGATFVDEEFNRKLLAKDDSDFLKYLKKLETYFAEDIVVDVIFEPGINYSDPLTQQSMTVISDIITTNQYYRPNITFWYDEFYKWMPRNNSDSFMVSLKTFLKHRPRFQADIFPTRDGKSIYTSRLFCYIKETRSSVAQRNAMTSLREDLKRNSPLPVFTSSYNFIYYEQFVSTLPETKKNLALATVAIFIVTSFFLVHPIVLFLVLVGFVSWIFELLALMYIWGVSLNAISMIILVMAIGFAVDYSAHVAHFYVFSEKNSPEEKVMDALETVGASVLMGGISTFLGMVVTAFGSAELFRIFFKMVLGIVVLGLLHGLCFLPVWLSIMCRHNFNIHLHYKTSIGDQNEPGDDTASPASDHDGSRANPALDTSGNPTSERQGPSVNPDTQATSL